LQHSTYCLDYCSYQHTVWIISAITHTVWSISAIKHTV
jgi:hypothetical protein